MRKAKRLASKPRAQVGALPLRWTDRGWEVLLVTTRTTSRWTVPKGWPMKGRKGHEAAAVEAWEEGGVIGVAKKQAVGRYLYWKRLDGYFALCRVKLFAVVVQDVQAAWPESTERMRYWLPARDAAEMVEEPGLKKALRGLRLGRPKQKSKAREAVSAEP